MITNRFTLFSSQSQKMTSSRILPTTHQVPIHHASLPLMSWSFDVSHPRVVTPENVRSIGSQLSPQKKKDASLWERLDELENAEKNADQSVLFFPRHRRRRSDSMDTNYDYESQIDFDGMDCHPDDVSSYMDRVHG